jgi:hypothetical protein
MPLMSLKFPSNVSYFLEFLVDVVTFNIIPTDKILNKFKSMKDKAENKIDANFS